MQSPVKQLKVNAMQKNNWDVTCPLCGDVIDNPNMYRMPWKRDRTMAFKQESNVSKQFKERALHTLTIRMLMAQNA